jgi:WD40 repeat protein
MERREGEGRRDLRIFCMYAPVDQKYYNRLQTHFASIKQQRDLQWMEIGAGEHIHQAIDERVHQAHFILLLLSPDFFQDSRCQLTMDRALDAWQMWKVPIVPVLLQACHWKETRCAEFSALPDNEKPVTSWSDSALAYENIVEGLLRVFPKPRSERSRVFSVPALPGYYVEPQSFQELKELLLKESGGQATTRVMGLYGMGGFGKTTQALALCHNSEIKKAFDHCILWIELGEQPPDELNLLRNLLFFLEVPLTRGATLEEARGLWRTALDRRVCLLVIDDVWSGLRGVLGTLLEGGPRCVRLVTTRQKRVIPVEVVWHHIDMLPQKEAIDVFCKGLSDEERRQTGRVAVERLVVLLSCWPLLLTLARSLVIYMVREHHGTMGGALQTVEQMYEEQGVVAFDLGEETVRECLEISLRHLARSVKTVQYHPVERYRELAIFPVGSEIPLVTLQKFWQKTGGLGGGGTKFLCMQLHRLSLLQMCTLDEDDVVRVQHAMHFFLYKEASEEELQRFHQQLLYAYACQHWAQLPLDEPYLWWHLARHLIGAGRSKEFVITVKDGNYLAAKIWVCKVYAVEADIDAAIKQAPDDISLRLLKRNIARISHLLLRCESLHEVGCVLHSRLSPFPELAETCSALERSASRPMLTSRYEFLDLSDPALQRTLDKHKSSVRGCAIAPNGAFIVSASVDHTLKVWDAKTGGERTTLSGHTAGVNKCAISPLGDFIVSASSDRTLRIWDLATGDIQGTLTGHADGVNDCAISSEGEHVISASDDGTLKIWRVATSSEEQTLPGYHGEVYSCAIIPTEQRILSTFSDARLQFWDLATGSATEMLTEHAGRINDCAVDSHGQHIVSASDDGTLRVWNARTGEQQRVLEGHTGKVFGCAISPGGERIVSASEDWTLKIWDARTGRELHTLKGHNGGVFDCAISSDGQWIVSASDDTTLKTWYMDSEEEEGRTATSYKGEVLNCAVSPSSSDVIVVKSETTALTVYNAEDGKERPASFDSTDGVNSCAVSPDGTWIASASGGGTLKLWDRQTGAALRTLRGHEGGVNACTISPDGTWIVSASGDRTLKIWDSKTGEVVHTLKGHTGWVMACAISPDGTWIVSASDDGELRIWDRQTGAALRTLSGHEEGVNACIISPDGTWIVSASNDRTLKIWDARTGDRVHTLQGHTGSVNACAVSLDEKWIVSASNDGTLRIWDARDMQKEACLTTLFVGNMLRTCAFFSNSEYLVAGGRGGLYFLRLLQ